MGNPAKDKKEEKCWKSSLDVLGTRLVSVVHGSAGIADMFRYHLNDLDSERVGAH
jgi:hypothetical protein